MTRRAEPYTAEELRIWRARERLSQTKVAELFGIAQRTLSHWECGDIPHDFSERFEGVLVAYYHMEKAS